MFPRTRVQRFELTRILPFLFFSFAASACGHTEAAPPDIPMTTVMQTIRDYGRGDHASPLRVPDSPPTESEEVYENRIRAILAAGDFAQLDQIAQANRAERGLLLGGVWKGHAFYAGVESPQASGELNDADYKQHFVTLGKWLAARPESAPAHIAMAYLYLNYAGFVRGSGYADTVSNRQWALYRVRTALAKQQLLEAAHLKDREAEWYMVMEYIANNEGWDKANARELFDQALAFQPGYYHYFRAYSDYLLPRWNGNPGDIQALAEEFARKNPEPSGSISYFQIMSALACYCSDDMAEMRNADWSRLKLGFANLDRYYGTSNLNANRYALMAVVFEDKPTASDAFQQVIERSPIVWLSEDNYNGVRSWAIGGDH